MRSISVALPPTVFLLVWKKSQIVANVRCTGCVYLRLREANVRQVFGFPVPQLIRTDDELLALQMTVVEKPDGEIFLPAEHAKRRRFFLVRSAWSAGRV